MYSKITDVLASIQKTSHEYKGQGHFKECIYSNLPVYYFYIISEIAF